MPRLRWIVLCVALALAALSVWQLRAGAAGLVAGETAAGTTPMTVLHRADAGPAPVVVIAHGFAGSRPIMAGIAQDLARAGYIAVSYDLLGHGMNPVPMSGDVTSVDGTTRLLVEELGRVIDAGLAHPLSDGRVAVLGHSMASDVVVRAAVADERVAATVGLSMFSLAVTADEPRNLLAVAGATEGWLAEQAVAALRLADPGAEAGQTVGDPAAGDGRRAVIAPIVGHVGILYSPAMLAEVRAWLDATFAHDGSAGGPPERRGPWVGLLLAAVLAVGWPLAALLGRWRAQVPPGPLPGRAVVLAAILPALATPFILWPVPRGFLPVMVADYIAMHFAVQGVAVLWLLRRAGAQVAPRAGDVALCLPVAAFGIAVFGAALQLGFVNVWPTPARLGVIAVMALGTVPFLMADAALTRGGLAPLWQTLVARGAALVSLGIAIALDFEGLFFLVIILPVILAFFVLWGTVAGWIGRATWRPAAGGIGLGLFLAWMLGATFPLFVP